MSPMGGETSMES